LIAEDTFGGDLVLVGKKDKFSTEIYKLVKKKGLEKRILLPGMSGYVSDEELVLLRKEAVGYVFPSLKEGFSLTPLEAQAVGLPCLISDIAVHREIYQDSVMYFDPLNVEAMKDSMAEFITNDELRAELSRKGAELVKLYAWDKTARVTAETFREHL
jgi:glycosyltransferase involved in cell wall biosynthesis